MPWSLRSSATTTPIGNQDPPLPVPIPGPGGGPCRTRTGPPCWDTRSPFVRRTLLAGISTRAVSDRIRATTAGKGGVLGPVSVRLRRDVGCGPTLLENSLNSPRISVDIPPGKAMAAGIGRWLRRVCVRAALGPGSRKYPQYNRPHPVGLTRNMQSCYCHTGCAGTATR